MRCYRFSVFFCNMKNNQHIHVMWSEITVFKSKESDYISLTDMVKNFGDDIMIYHRMRNRNTLEFIWSREELYNPDFKGIEFETFKKEAWLNTFSLTPRKRIEATGAIGIISKAGRYGWWTFAHKDIAFEFATRISPKFKLYLIKEFQRLKEQEMKALDWNVKRFLTKMNYKIHTDAIKENLIPKELSPNEINFVYADEADMLNKALFGMTAKGRQEKNPWKKWQGELPGKGKRGWPGSNVRDYATIEQLIVLANMESINAELIAMWYQQSQRLASLNRTAITQMKSLMNGWILPKLLNKGKR